MPRKNRRRDGASGQRGSRWELTANGWRGLPVALQIPPPPRPDLVRRDIEKGGQR